MSTFSLLFIAVLGIALLLFLVIYVRLQAFVALLIASLFVAMVGGIPPAEIAGVIQEGMGNTLGYIAIIVGLGAIFGEILQASGGAEIISDTLLKKAGEKRATWALGFTGLIVAIPVFFDVALILFIPLIYSIARRTGRSLLYYGIPLTAGIAVGHSFIPPTPGPVAVAGLLGADLGWVILFGLISGIPAMIVGGVFFGKYIANKIHVVAPMEDSAESEPAALSAPSSTATSTSSTVSAASNIPSDRPDDRPDAIANPVPPDAIAPAPSGVSRTSVTAERSPKEPLTFGMVVGIIAVPLVLILLNTVVGVALPEDNFLRGWIVFLGHPFVALTLATLLAFYFLGTRQGYSRRDIMNIATRSFEPVGLIILVTGAGGVLGRVLITTGVGEALADAMASTRLPIIFLAFLIATAVRVSQGSATVSMVTAAGLIAPAVQLAEYSAPMVAAITIAIACGATVLSHVNDSGFWLVGKYFGLSEKQTLQSWTVMETIIGVVGFLVVLIISFFL
jgi:Gnt-I system low-affinity gluconate transporter